MILYAWEPTWLFVVPEMHSCGSRVIGVTCSASVFSPPPYKPSEGNDWVVWFSTILSLWSAKGLKKQVLTAGMDG
ncbi:hypothetical protein QTO34_007290 [Cnephaeus nilssonii]|uniref:Uncharacterized protein n=1 Tax=Cnephaeus nilssonii TaxID=3371016 RepID=A0AA40HKP1_CNENI|nr:hypothetical protein QTO34_007290 [Eptesicus nilssonii]